MVGDRVNLRSRPLAEAEVAGQVSAGETLLAPEGIPEGAEWVKVRPPPSTDLWIFSALVSDGVVTADDTYVREYAFTAAARDSRKNLHSTKHRM